MNGWKRYLVAKIEAGRWVRTSWTDTRGLHPVAVGRRRAEECLALACARYPGMKYAVMAARKVKPR